MPDTDRMYVVMHSSDGEHWSAVTDEETRRAPAAYEGELAAYERRDEMAELFPEHHYRVEVFGGPIHWEVTDG